MTKDQELASKNLSDCASNLPTKTFYPLEDVLKDVGVDYLK